MVKHLILWLRSIRHAIYILHQNRVSRQVASTWDSNLLAASEELLDDNDLSVTISLPAGVTYDKIVSSILNEARGKPDYWAIISSLTCNLGLTRDDSTKAIDRTLGGVVRAASMQSQYCPDSVRDPIAWHSFQKAIKDPAIIKDIYGEWPLPVPKQS